MEILMCFIYNVLRPLYVVVFLQEFLWPIFILNIGDVSRDGNAIHINMLLLGETPVTSGLESLLGSSESLLQITQTTLHKHNLIYSVSCLLISLTGLSRKAPNVFRFVTSHFSSFVQQLCTLHFSYVFILRRPAMAYFEKF